jgi:anthranilate phosphoribosyltransferase
MSNPTTATPEHGLEVHGGWPGVLGTLADGHDLSGEASSAVLHTILAGEATDAQIAAFIVGLRIKGETVEELTGLQQAMIDAASPLSVPDDTIDIVGVGGAPSRRTGALNVSTMAAFVAAGAGATVCKHGNRKASSTSGSFDLLEALGVAIDIDPPALERHVAEVGIGFAFARTFHPAMRHVGPVRAELGIPTVFNILGPLSHPGRVRRQVIGAADWSIADRMARVRRATGSQRALVVHGDGGLDELTTTGPSKMISVDGDDIDELIVDAADLGLARAQPDDLVGGDAAANAAIARRVFAGEPGQHRDIVALNAAAGIVVAGLADDLDDGLAQATAAIDDGRAAGKLQALIDS